ncbi:MAG: CDP-diacylglycerol--serine O-phosphatidyltransferase [bacterium]|nr:CDP-diacylglycerol--serine O-phosphatidyltransferase [bacterium]
MRRTDLYWIANLLTFGNLFLGFLAIIKIFEGNYLLGCWLIVCASLCDGLDGKVARFARRSSELGIELDSLADVVSFGVAPATLLYFISFQKYGLLGLLLSALPLLFGALRLARFNTTATTGDKGDFEGLPIPMQANTIATFVVFNFALWGDLHLELFLIPLTVILAFLMISHLHYEAMPWMTFRSSGKNPIKLIGIIAGIILVAAKPPVFLFLLLSLYVLKGPLNAIFNHEPSHHPVDDALEDETLI